MREDYENINKKEKLEFPCDLNNNNCVGSGCEIHNNKIYDNKIIVKRQCTEKGVIELYVESDSKTGELTLSQYLNNKFIKSRILVML